MPRQSIGMRRRSSAGFARSVSRSAITAIGTLIQKIERHVHCRRKLPAIGPIDVSPPVMPKKMASALPRSPGSNALTTMASAAGNSTAPNAPWTMRKTISHHSPALPVGAAPQSADAPAKPITPTMTMRR